MCFTSVSDSFIFFLVHRLSLIHRDAHEEMRWSIRKLRLRTSPRNSIQAKLADLSTEIEAARLLTYKAAVLKDQGASFTLTAAQAKLKTGRLAVRATEEAVQIHGGYGYIEEYPVCRFYRDAKILTIGEGTDEVQQMVIARALGA
jgi:short-chain 2-methylacyl-CoA dehydrogenase